MYTDDEERKGLPIKTFLISLILIIVLVLLLVWLLPMPNLKGLNNRIFNSNIQEMKNAAIPYFTTDRLPQEIGDSKTLTLQEMIDLKLLLPFTDKNGDKCDTEKSYVTLTKRGTEDDSYYELKVYLKCNDDEDYILVTLGCYSYCTSAICEPKKEDKPSNPNKPSGGNNNKPVVSTGPSCVLYIASGTKGSNGWYLNNPVVKFKSKSTSTSGASIVKYGLSTGSVQYNGNDSFTVTKEGSTTVYGYVKDSNGKTATCSIVVKKDSAKPSCNLSVLEGTKGADGSYTSNVVIGFSSKNDNASGISAFGLTNSSSPAYNNQSKYTITTNGQHKIYGYVKDAAGNTATCSINVSRNKPSTPVEPNESVPSCSLKVTSGNLGSNGWYLGNVTVGFATKGTTNGATVTGFGLGTSENYNGSTSLAITKDGATTVYGYVKDSNGNTATCSISVKKDATKPSCSLKVVSGTFNNNGYYTSDVTVGFNSKTDATSGISGYGLGKSETYAGNSTYLINKVGQHTIYGYVKDAAGNKATCSITVEKRNNIEYQYKKDFSRQYSAWGAWTTYTYSKNNPPKFGKYELIEMEDLGKSQEVDYYQYTKGEPIYVKDTVKVGTINQTYCTGYKYYRTTTNNTTTTYAVSESDDWVFEGRITTTGVPTNTLAVKFELVGLDWSNCGTGCTRAPKKIWNKYSRRVYKATSTNTVTTLSGVSTPCGSTATRQVEVFATVDKLVGYEEVRTPVYKDVYRYRRRTRTVTQEAYTDYKWSTYNDTKLLNQGYTMTGNTRVVD